MRSPTVLCSLGVLCYVLLAIGCGSGDGTVATVEGVVKLDGRPLPNAMVEFYPQDGGRTSSGKTDDDGHYELKYSMKVDGAVVGKHSVKIMVGRFEDGELLEKEVVPARYNVKSELVKEVSSGSNEINFDLESGGEIIQPSNDPPVGGGGGDGCPDCGEDW